MSRYISYDGYACLNAKSHPFFIGGIFAKARSLCYASPMVKSPQHKYYEQHRAERIAYAKQYYRKHKEHLNVKRRERRRLTQIHYCKGKLIIGNLRKTPYPTDELCQICKRKQHLTYHHDGDDYNNGIWICNRCHFAIHACDESPNLRIFLMQRWLR